MNKGLDKITDKKFVVGEIYMLNFYYVFVVESNEKFEINYDITRTNDFKTTTLVKYIGNNKFEEYYSGITINLMNKEKLVFEDSIEYYDKMLEFIKNPLCIEGEYVWEIKEDKANSFVKNVGSENEIVEKVTKLMDEVQKGLKDKIAECVAEDYEKACLENCVFDFKKGRSYAKKVVRIKVPKK